MVAGRPRRGDAVTVADVEIESIAAGGDGVARSNGVVVFVPRSAPGDRLRARLDVRRRFARGEIELLLAASPQRVEPECAHYVADRCGGCQLQHLRYDAQLEVKQRIVRDSLARIGKRRVELPEIVPSPRQWRYRTKLALTMRRAGDGDEDWLIGLRPYDAPGRLFGLIDCPITDERVLAVWKDVAAARRFFPEADELRAAVQLSSDEVSITMRGGHVWPNRAEFFEAVPSATSLWWQPTHRARNLVASRGDSTRRDASASFAQVNPEVGALMHAYVLERARAHRPGTVLDAYSGTGATAVPLARDGARVTAIEADRDASAQCAESLAAFAGSRALAARFEDVIDQALPADVVLLNPPRVGLHERIPVALAGASPAPRSVIYVSCDPATLARDVARLPQFRIASLRAFDMFPQTAHVETVCELVPETA
jgi:23S rRNA (uracil1939-C5)-methyltransferase